jgi:MFS family permease
MPIFVAPVAGILSDRIGGRRIVATGLALQAFGLGWLATVSTPSVSYLTLVPGLAISGFGMGLFFAPVANLVLSSVNADEQGIASGAHNAIRELGGVFGVAILASIFAHKGGYGSPQLLSHGLHPAVWVGAVLVGLGAVAAFFIPKQPVSAVTADAFDMGAESEALQASSA